MSQEELTRFEAIQRLEGKTLDRILLIIRLGVPWYDLPSFAVGDYFSWQSWYRLYRRWQRSGLMNEIHRQLYQDLN